MPSNDAAVAVQNFLRSMQGDQTLRGPEAQSQEPKIFTTLPDLLPSTTTIPVIDSADEKLVDNLLSHLPPTLLLLAQEVDDISSVDPTSETAKAAMEALSMEQKKDILRKVMRSPQFHQSLGSLTGALRDGGLPTISDALAIPHRQMAVRGFVLAPLAEIAPGWAVPGTPLRIRHLAARLTRTARLPRRARAVGP
jgi:hypothetical protein